MQTRDRLFIGNEWVAPATDGTIEVISPHTEECHRPGPRRDAGRHRQGRRRRARRVRRRPVADDDARGARRRPSPPVARRSRRAATRSPTSSPSENGSPELVVDHGPGLLGDDGARHLRRPRARLPVGGRARRRDGRPVRVRRAPVGVAAAIIPWNVPLFITALKLGPAMAAGCTIVLKPAPETPLDAYLLAEAVIEAGIPAGVINIVAAPAARPASTSSRHPGIDKVSFTGSHRGGHAHRRAVRRAAQARARSSSAASRRRSCSTTSTSTTPLLNDHHVGAA